MANHLIDLTGKRFGSLLVLRRSDDRVKQAYWLCKCVCGSKKAIRGSSLRYGVSVSCGCSRRVPKYWRVYWAQKNNAALRRIKFKLTFEQWLQVWQESGHLHERGRLSQQYCMARFGDQGAYEVGNVKIITTEENCKERQYSEVTRQRMSEKGRGRPKPQSFFDKMCGRKQSPEHIVNRVQSYMRTCEARRREGE